MADNRTEYRDPNVTTAKDSGGMPSWLKWLLIAIVVLAALWLLAPLLLPDDDATLGTAPATDPGAIVVEEGAEVETVPVVPVD
jgi:hypothetical protein